MVIHGSPGKVLKYFQVLYIIFFGSRRGEVGSHVKNFPLRFLYYICTLQISTSPIRKKSENILATLASRLCCGGGWGKRNMALFG